MSNEERVWRERGLRDAVLAGNEQAWRLWYAESFDPLYAYVLWRCAGLRDLADDIAQETWLVAVRRIRSFRPEQAGFRTWLEGIAANLLRNHFRRRRTRPQTVALDGVDQSARDENAAGREQSEAIAAALAALPEHYEAVLRAKYLEQHSVEQIASVRHETPKAIESQLTRARQAFRAVYESEPESNGFVPQERQP